MADARANLLVVDHPAVADRLARLRDRETPTPVFRNLMEELGAFLAYEATRHLPLRDEKVTTPLEVMTARRIATRPVVAPNSRPMPCSKSEISAFSVGNGPSPTRVV